MFLVEICRNGDWIVRFLDWIIGKRFVDFCSRLFRVW